MLRVPRCVLHRIRQSCSLQVTGPVALEDPYIAADQLAGLDPGSPTAASARLATSVTLVNAGGAALRCVLVASIAEAPHTGLRDGATCASIVVRR